jgi:hypothetical protein
MSEIEQTPAFIQFYKDYDKILISDKTDLSKTTDPVTFWAFDDTAQPAKQYRYRVRLGIFNPIAGTDQFADGKTPLKDKVIMWTNFAEPQSAAGGVQIPARQYFFAQAIEELKKRVTVLVACYKLGSWYTKDFKVTPGDSIGQRIEKTSDENGSEDDNLAALLSPGSVRKPAEVDYSTGEVLLDAVQMTEWSGGSTLYPRPYFQILYSRDGSEIFRMPVGDKYWPDNLHEAYYAAKAGENTPNTLKEAFKVFGEGRQGIKQKIIDQKQQQTPATSPALKGVDPALLELMRKRMGGAQQQQN